MAMRKLSYLARRVFRPLDNAKEPVRLFTKGFEPFEVILAIEEVSSMGLIRVVVTDDDPTKCLYVPTATAVGAFAPRRVDKILDWIGGHRDD